MFLGGFSWPAGLRPRRPERLALLSEVFEAVGFDALAQGGDGGDSLGRLKKVLQ